jgi:SAM-dependent methyltransferase
VTAFDYWASGRGLGNITPQGKAWPEGDAFPSYLRRIVGARKVLEFGCGVGRLAALFAPDRYVGIDISVDALARAHATLPEHRFALVGRDGLLPPADVTLAHTVLLHVPDEDLPVTLARFESPALIVSEILDRGWRREGDPPVFNREIDDYVAALAGRYRLCLAHRMPYPHYPNTDLTIAEFVRV